MGLAEVGHIGLRNSKFPDQKPLVMRADVWDEFLMGIKEGDLNIMGGRFHFGRQAIA